MDQGHQLQQTAHTQLQNSIDTNALQEFNKAIMPASPANIAPGTSYSPERSQLGFTAVPPVMQGLTPSGNQAQKTTIAAPSRAHRRTNPICQVDGCGEDLSDEKYKVYHRRNRICDEHFKCLVCFHKGQNMRYCQQCHKFHEIDAFDFGKHSCRAKLQKRAGKAQRAAALSAAERERDSRRAWPAGQDPGLGMSITDASSSATAIDMRAHTMESEASLSLMPGGLAARLGFGTAPAGMQVGLSGTWRGLQGSQLQAASGSLLPSVGGLLTADAAQRHLLQQQQQQQQGFQQLQLAGRMMSVDSTSSILDRRSSLLSAMSNAGVSDVSYGSLSELRQLQALQQQQQQQQQLLLQRQVSRNDLGMLPQGHSLGAGLSHTDLALLGFDSALTQAVRREEEMKEAMGQLQVQLQQRQAEQQRRLLMQQQQQQQQGAQLGPMLFSLQAQGGQGLTATCVKDEYLATMDVDGRSSAGSVSNLAWHSSWAENELDRLSRERQRPQLHAISTAGPAGASAEDLAAMQQHMQLQRGVQLHDPARQQQQQQQALLTPLHFQQVVPAGHTVTMQTMEPQGLTQQQQHAWDVTQRGLTPMEGTHMFRTHNMTMAAPLSPAQQQGSPSERRPRALLADMVVGDGGRVWQPDQPGL